MARKRKPIPHEILMPFYSRWRHAGKKESGDIIREMHLLSGISRSDIYFRFNELKRGESPLEVSGITQTRTHHKSETELAELKHHIVIITMIKYGSAIDRKGYGMSWTRAIEIAEKDGRIPKGIYNRSKVERWARHFGLSNDWMKYEGQATQLCAQYANQVWMVDATPASAYYFHFKQKSIIYRPDLQDDKHIIENMEKEGLWKIWVYYMRDLFSGAYLLYPFAPNPITDGARNGGENSVHWVSAMRWAMTPKPDFRIPVQGIPELIICDKGSGLMSTFFKGFFERLRKETIIRAHKPKRPQAKGPIEGQISAGKRSWEASADRAKFDSMADLLHFMHEWMIWDNHQHGYFDRWMESTKIHPIHRTTRKAFQDALVTTEERTVRAWHTVEINKKHWHINGPVKLGDRVTIYTDSNGVKTAQTDDGIKYSMNPAGKVRRDVVTFGILDGRGDDIHITDADRLRAEVKIEAKKLKPLIKPSSYLPDTEGQVRYLPAQGEEVETHSPVANHMLTLEVAWRYIEIEAGTTRAEMDPDDVAILNEAMDHMIKATGHVDPQFLYKTVNILLDQEDHETAHG